MILKEKGKVKDTARRGRQGQRPKTEEQAWRVHKEKEAHEVGRARRRVATRKSLPPRA